MHIINLQEIGCDEDQKLVQEVTEWLGKELDKKNKFQMEIANLPTGAQGLKVATIYNSKVLTKDGDTKGLIQSKKGKDNQYGFIQHFKIKCKNDE